MTHRGPFQPLLFCDSVIMFAEDLIAGAQPPPKQRSPSYSHEEGQKKRKPLTESHNTFPRKARSGWGPSSAIKICVRSQLLRLPGTVKSNVVCGGTVLQTNPDLHMSGEPLLGPTFSSPPFTTALSTLTRPQLRCYGILPLSAYRPLQKPPKPNQTQSKKSILLHFTVSHAT